jgi:hypothetical protein
VQQRVPALARGHKCLFEAGLACASVHECTLSEPEYPPILRS